MGAPGMPVPPDTPQVNKPVMILVNIFLGPLYFLPAIIISVVSKMKKPIIFLITSGFVFTKMDKPTKTAIEPEIETGNTSDQLTFFMALGRIAKAPNIYIGVIMPIAAIGPNNITSIGTEIVPPPKPV